MNFRRLVYRNRPYTSTSMTDKNTHLCTQQRMLNFPHEYSLFERINVLAACLLNDFADFTQCYNLRKACSMGPMFLFSVVFIPSPSSHHGSVWVLPVISLLLTNTVSPVRSCPLPMPNHMMGEVSWNQKRRRSVAS
jgi:hypothetical protein